MVLDPKRSLLDFVQSAPLDPNFKNDFVLLANESLIKAVESRLDKNPGEIGQASRQGYVLAPFFAEQLPVFEKQEQGMRFYFEEMANAIDLKKEDTRIASIKFDAAPLVRLGEAGSGSDARAAALALRRYAGEGRRCLPGAQS